MSIGFANRFSGSRGTNDTVFVADPASRGGAIRGYMPPATYTTDKTYNNYEQIRFSLRNAWNTSYQQQLARNNVMRPIITPFRATMNAGDLMARENYSCGGSCQTSQSRPNVKGLRQRFGAIQSTCTPSSAFNSLQLIRDIPPAACNGRYVYDSSNYITYVKQKAILKNYNDLSNGGDQSAASQSAIRAIRRY